MKFKSLFLASLAAMAMVSCSNENDPINNGEEAAKDAVFNFSIAMPTAAATRATDEGTVAESTVSSITFVLDYEGATETFKKTYSNIAEAFTKSGNKYTLKTAELVAPGKAIAYVYVNGAEATELTTTTGFLTTYALDNNFYMTGKSAAFDIIAQKTDNSVSVAVDRVAVKLEEITDADKGVDGRQSKFKTTAKSQTNVAELYLDIQNYTFSNLNQKSNALKGTIFSPTTPSTETFFNYFVKDAQENKWGTTFKETKAFADQITYCFENDTDPTTQVWYQAKVSAKFTDGTTEETLGTFFVYENKLYKNFDALDTQFNGYLTELGLSEASTNQDFMTKIGAEKYTAGVCYYKADVAPAGETINRNNWYKLSISSIKDLGLPELDIPEPGKPTMLLFDVTVNPWTVNTHDIEL